jgi:hypothetical protein
VGYSTGGITKKQTHFSWNHLVELFSGINRVLPPARLPARGHPTPRAAPRPRQRPPRAAPRSSIRRPLALFRCRRSTDKKTDKTGPIGPVLSVLTLLLKLQVIPPANYQRSSQRSRHIFRRCQQMASHLAVAPLPRATAPSSPMICRRQPS